MLYMTAATSYLYQVVVVCVGRQRGQQRPEQRRGELRARRQGGQQLSAAPAPMLYMTAATSYLYQVVVVCVGRQRGQQRPEQRRGELRARRQGGQQRGRAFRRACQPPRLQCCI
ncbi:hypothetical protein O0L34_g14362 [Tuta absoluta]|nr:hypothetical protein O0L34_g14362 [Tuta absoluta]